MRQAEIACGYKNRIERAPVNANAQDALCRLITLIELPPHLRAVAAWHLDSR
jgi:hypothetical protein